MLAWVSALVAVGAVLLAQQRPDPASTDPGPPALETVPATPASGANQSLCASWNAWVDTQAAYVAGGPAEPAVADGRAVLQQADRLTFTQAERAGLQFLLEPYTGPSALTVPDMGVNNRNARAFVAWLEVSCR